MINKKTPLVIIILGPPGSGKGTQTNFLIKKFKLEYIGSGELLRNRKKKKDFVGKKISDFIDNGRRVPTPVIFKLWMDKMDEFKRKRKLNGFVIDGSPRTALEAEMLDQALEWYCFDKNKKVIFVDVPQEEVISRIANRRVCLKCKRNIPYIGEFKNIEKCDKCGGKLVKRKDDNKKGIKERLRWYNEEVRVAIDFYRKQKKLIKINGDQLINKVLEDILEALNINENK